MQIYFRCKHLLSFTSYIECFAVATDNVLSHGNKKQPYVSQCHGDGIGVLFVENLDHRSRLSVEGKTELACYTAYSAVTWLFADGHLQKDTAHCGTTAHWREKATWSGELSYLRALTSSQMSQEESVLYKALVQLCANLFISLSCGPCTFGVSEDEAFHTSNFLMFIYISSLQLLDF